MHDQVLIESRARNAEVAASVVESAMIRGLGELISSVPVVVDVKVGNNWAEMIPARLWRS